VHLLSPTTLSPGLQSEQNYSIFPFTQIWENHGPYSRLGCFRHVYGAPQRPPSPHQRVTVKKLPATSIWRGRVARPRPYDTHPWPHQQGAAISFSRIVTTLPQLRADVVLHQRRYVRRHPRGDAPRPHLPMAPGAFPKKSAPNFVTAITMKFSDWKGYLTASRNSGTPSFLNKEPVNFGVSRSLAFSYSRSANPGALRSILARQPILDRSRGQVLLFPTCRTVCHQSKAGASPAPKLSRAHTPGNGQIFHLTCEFAHLGPRETYGHSAVRQISSSTPPAGAGIGGLPARMHRPLKNVLIIFE